jgi:hypothetical protein
LEHHTKEKVPEFVFYSIKKIIPTLFVLFTIAFLSQIWGFCKTYPTSWMIVSTIVIGLMFVPLFFFYSKFKHCKQKETFVLIEEEVREENEVADGQRFAIELEELLMDSGKDRKYDS